MLLKKLENLLGIKTIANISWVQANNSVMCGYFCIGFIDFMLGGKKLTGYASLFSYDFKKTDDIILTFQKWIKVILSNYLTEQT